MSVWRRWLWRLGFLLVMWAGAFGIAFGVVEWRADDDAPGVDGQLQGDATGTATPAITRTPRKTGTEAEAIAIDYMYEAVDADPNHWLADWLEDYLPVCNAEERTDNGWAVQCDMQHKQATMKKFEQIVTYVVYDNGLVRTP